jgi:glycosidase
MDKTNIENRKELLKGVFNEQDSILIDNGLQDILRKNRAALHSREAGRSFFSQHDAILITYPDQILEEGVSPLHVLSEFCERHVDGLIPCLHILPFFPYSSDDGFSVLDYRRVDPALGTWDDISRIRKSFRLMVDAVINHISAGSDWFQDYLKGAEARRNFFIEVPGNPDLSRVVRPRSSPLLHSFAAAAGEKKVWTTFSSDQVDLNYRNPQVLLEMADLLLFYVTRGATIIRLDAVAFLWKEIGTSCINLPQTHRMVRLFRSLLAEAAPDVKLVTETNIPHEQNIAYFGSGDNEAHLVYNFALPPLILHTFHSGDSGPLTRWAGGLNTPSKQTAFLNFLASHDGIGLNPVRGILPDTDIQRMVERTLACGGRISLKRNPDGSTQPYELNVNYLDALSDPSGGDSPDRSARRFLAAHAILFSLAGVPAIYFHSLFGSHGWPGGIERTGSNRAINRQKLERAAVERELQDPSSLRSRVFQGMARLIRLRAGSRAFDPQAAQRVLDVGRAAFCIERVPPEGGGAMLCLQNVTDRKQDIPMNAMRSSILLSEGLPLTDGISGSRIDPRSMNAIPLEPYQPRWFSVADRAPQTPTERNVPV